MPPCATITSQNTCYQSKTGLARANLITLFTRFVMPLAKFKAMTVHFPLPGGHHFLLHVFSFTHMFHTHILSLGKDKTFIILMYFPTM